MWFKILKIFPKYTFMVCVIVELGVSISVKMDITNCVSLVLP